MLVFLQSSSRLRPLLAALELNFKVLGVRRSGISENFYIFVRYGGRKDMEIARRR